MPRHGLKRATSSKEPNGTGSARAMMACHERLHWMQRIALVRHNLHIASSTGDFAFFKSLQANHFCTEVDHAANLRALLGEDAEIVLANLDKSNAVIGFVHEDSFKKIFDLARANLSRCSIDSRRSGDEDARAAFNSSIIEQRRIADSAIDKMVESAISCISQLPLAAQDDAAEIFITGATFIADAMQICLLKISSFEHANGDYARHDNTWTHVQLVVGSAVSALKGVFTLMSDGRADNEDTGPSKPLRSSSIDAIARNLLRRLSISAAGSSSSHSPAASRRSSITSPVIGGGYLLNSPATKTHHNRSGSAVSTASTRALSCGTFTRMPTIPPTPAYSLHGPFGTAVATQDAFPFPPVKTVGDMAGELKPRNPSITSTSTAGTGVDPKSFTRRTSVTTTGTNGTNKSQLSFSDGDAHGGSGSGSASASGSSDAYTDASAGIPTEDGAIHPSSPDPAIDTVLAGVEAVDMARHMPPSAAAIDNAHAVRSNSSASAMATVSTEAGRRASRAGSKSSAGDASMHTVHLQHEGQAAADEERPGFFKRLSTVLSIGSGKSP